MHESQISSHVLDHRSGSPAAGISVELSRAAADGWIQVGVELTDLDGRANNLASGRVSPGTYRLRVATASYFAAQGATAFFPRVDVVFEVPDEDRHFHVPVLIAPRWYSSYLGV